MASAAARAAPNRHLDFPSPPFRAEREGPIAERWEGEVGNGKRSGIPHLTPTLSAPGGGEGVPVSLQPGDAHCRAITLRAIERVAVFAVHRGVVGAGEQ